MILHIGGDEFVSKKSIVMILDAKCIRDHSDNLFFLQSYSPEFTERLQNMNPGGQIKSVVFTEEGAERKVYFSPISVSTLLKRAEENNRI